MKHTTFGMLGEAFAARLLEADGYCILERNFRCAAGEVDLIAEKDGAISFIEVKTRSSVRFGRPAEAVTEEKKQRIRRAAAVYLAGKGMEDCGCSFQVIEILYSRIRNAF